MLISNNYFLENMRTFIGAINDNETVQAFVGSIVSISETLNNQLVVYNERGIPLFVTSRIVGLNYAKNGDCSIRTQTGSCYIFSR